MALHQPRTSFSLNSTRLKLLIKLTTETSFTCSQALSNRCSVGQECWGLANGIERRLNFCLYYSLKTCTSFHLRCKAQQRILSSVPVSWTWNGWGHLCRSWNPQPIVANVKNLFSFQHHKDKIILTRDHEHSATSKITVPLLIMVCV